MDIVALLTYMGVNIAICILFFFLYSILRNQPINFNVYFLGKLEGHNNKDFSLLERLVPSASWIKKAWEASEENNFFPLQDLGIPPEQHALVPSFMDGGKGIHPFTYADSNLLGL